MDRRAFLAGTGAVLLAAPLAAEAQQANDTRRIGYLGLNSLPEVQPLLEAFRLSLRQRGWTEGRDVVIEYRFAKGDTERVPELARDLVRAKVDVIVAPTETLIIAARQATATIPIVMVVAGDPVASGLVASLARPGGNVTGLTISAPDLAGKRLQLLREAVPRLSRVAVLWNADNPAKALELKETRATARLIGTTIQSIPLRGRDPAWPGAFLAMRGERVQAAIVLGDAFTFGHRGEIAALAEANRLPTMWEVNIFMDAGGLMSYGPVVVDHYRRAAAYVDRILKGVRPADLPVEQPTKFELVINLKTAKTLGLAIPQSVLQRADEVIQ
jgi:putative ABC transport system substrate-binding protein